MKPTLIRLRKDYMAGHTSLKPGERLAPPICTECEEQTQRIGTSLQHNIALFACPHCDPQIFAELDRMGHE